MTGRKVLIGSIVISYIAGILTALCFASPWMAFAGAFAFCGILFTALKVHDGLKEQNLSHSRVLTTPTATGYKLRHADIYEAIEKLGYYEHEMEV